MTEQGRTPTEHIAEAERFADSLRKGIAGLAASGESANASDIAFWDVLFHAAEVHLKIADAKRRHVTDVAYQPRYG